ncbi:MAG TPA: PEP-CTERM sorting domain-containing protein, partial [Aquabacterium sp.]|nr:PEP-CTERM sorting domain-containing protein [Aquabacterium sp.]
QSAAFPTGANYGTVDLTQNGSFVDVLVSLSSGYRFVKTGGHDTFTFNLGGASGYTVSNISSSKFNWFEPASNPGFGSFTDGLECGSCRNGGAGAQGSTLSFRVNGVSLADFKPNTKGYFFSADIIGRTGTTGAVAAVPEPESYALTFAGLGVVTLLAIRRNKS